MALMKAITTPFGVDATYHHITALLTHFREGCCDVTLASYLDEGARRAGCKPLGSLPTIRLDMADLPGDTEPRRDAIYLLLSARPDWEGATAV